MKKILLVSAISVVLISCFSNKSKKIDERLPKDIALMPKRTEDLSLEEQRQIDEEKLRKVHQEIEELIGSVTCTDAVNWRITPFGSKPCGGPATFIAYPIEVEDEVLPKITDYNRESSAFNLKYGITSDCNVVTAPVAVKCVGGEAILSYE
ncbi:MAG: hypothetical protein Q4C75_02690 [Bergeyella zoohelcum]|nr:hypothetical protein [Bergeyella zoohelcum]